MKVCFYHQDRDVDVSSGTEHARHQWHETCMSFGVTELAVINETDTPYKPVNDSLPVTEYATIDDFMEATQGEYYFIEQGDYPSHREITSPNGHWVCIGGTQGLPRDLTSDADHDIEYFTINAEAILYPREAAVIILEHMWALSH